MEHNPPAVLQSPVGVTSPRTVKKYWDEAYYKLEDKVKDDLNKAKGKFDDCTKTAIKKLARKRSTPETQATLQAILDKKYVELDVPAKGELQSLARTAKKELDKYTIDRISFINENSKASGIGNIERDSRLAQFEELLAICLTCQQKAKTDQSKFVFLGREGTFEQLWSKVVKGINKFKAIGDLATSAHSTATLVWGVFKVLLEFAVQGEKGQEEVLTGIATSLDTIQRGTVYEKQIQKIIESSDKSSESHLAVFESCLISTYERIYRFLATAAVCLEKSKISLGFYVFWNSEDILNFQQDVLKLEQVLFQDASIRHMLTQSANQSELRELLLGINARLGEQEHVIQEQRALMERGVERHTAASSQIEALLSAINQQLAEIKELREQYSGTTREEVLKWVSNTEVADDHNTSQGRRMENTARWIFDREEYVSWAEADGPRLLWIKGNAGVGKTILVSSIIDELQKQHKSTPDFQLAYFYCKRDDENRRFGHRILRSFIRQFAFEQPRLPESLQECYKKKVHGKIPSSKFGLEECLDLLKDLIPTTCETILVLDALDECVGNDEGSTAESKEMVEFLEVLEKLFSQGLPIKILISSRYDSESQNNLTGYDRIEISSAVNSNDIENMVRGQIDAYNKWQKLKEKGCKRKGTVPPRVKKDLREKIMRVFGEKSQGMFQWASLHITHLLEGLKFKTFRGLGDVESELGNLPTDLKTAYESVFTRIMNGGETQKETALRVFRWLLASQGSFNRTVLVAATCQTFKGNRLDTVEGGDDFVLKACRHLVVSEGSLLRFSHLSVQEYFEQYHVLEPQLATDCHLDVAKVCTLTLFRLDSQQVALKYWDVSLNYNDSSKDEHYSLWDFACSQWYTYFINISNEAQRDEIKSIVMNSSLAHINGWLLVLASNMVREWKTRPPKGWNTDPETFPRFYYAPLPPRNFDFYLNPSFGPWENRRQWIRLDEYESIFELALDPAYWTGPAHKPSLISEFPNSLVVAQAILCGILRKMVRFIHKSMMERNWGRNHKREWLKHFPPYLRLQFCRGPMPQRSSEAEAENACLRDEDNPDDSDNTDDSDNSDDSDNPDDSDMPRTDTIEDTWKRSLEWMVEWAQVEQGDEEFFQTLFKMLIHFEDQKTVESVGEILELRSIFSKMSEPIEACYEELARLTLLLLCAKGRNDRPHMDFAEFLFEKFPNAAGTDYVHLVPGVDRLDLSDILVRAARTLDSRFIEIVQSHGTSLNTTTRNGTPLIAAISAGNMDNVEFLLEKGAKVNAQCKKGRLGSALIAACAKDERDVQVLPYTLRRPTTQFYAVSRAEDCSKALNASSKRKAGRMKTMKMLLDKGALVNKTVKYGRYATALDAAVDARAIRAVRFLISHGARKYSEAVVRDRYFASMFNDSDWDWIDWNDDGSSNDSDSDCIDLDWDNGGRFSKSNWDCIEGRCYLLIKWLIIQLIRATGQDHGVADDDDNKESDHWSVTGDDFDEMSQSFSESLSENSEIDSEDEDGKEEEDDKADDHEQSSTHDGSEQPRLNQGNDLELDLRAETVLASEQAGPLHEEQRDTIDYYSKYDNGGNSDITMAGDIQDIIRTLNSDLCFSSHQVAETLINMCGFNYTSRENENALARGFQKLLELNSKQDLDAISEAWFWFLDLAEKFEEAEALFSGDIKILENGGVDTDLILLKRRSTSDEAQEMAPSENADDNDNDNNSEDEDEDEDEGDTQSL